MARRLLPAVLEDVREYFSLRRSEERARGLDEAERSKLAKAVQLSAQKRMAAQALFELGHRAEALALAREAYAQLQAYASLATQKVEGEELLAREAPPLEDGITDAHVELYQSLVGAQIPLQIELGAISLDSHERAARRLSRRTLAGAVAFVLMTGVIWSFRHTVLTAQASAQSGDRWGPANAVDGIESTHWVLPDKVLGHLDVTIHPAQKLLTVTVMNGWDPPGYAVRDYRLEAYSGTTLLKSQDGTLAAQPAGGAKPNWTTIPFAVDAKVDRLRIVVKSHFDHAGALAEVKIP
jgi:hypothetical protein